MSQMRNYRHLDARTTPNSRKRGRAAQPFASSGSSEEQVDSPGPAARRSKRVRREEPESEVEVMWVPY